MSADCGATSDLLREEEEEEAASVSASAAQETCWTSVLDGLVEPEDTAVPAESDRRGVRGGRR